MNQPAALFGNRKRRRLAAGLERAVKDAHRRSLAIGAAIPVQRDAVLACGDELLELAERLRVPGPAYAQGVAIVDDLLTNPHSALYQPDGDLGGAVESALAALDGRFG